MAMVVSDDVMYGTIMVLSVAIGPLFLNYFSSPNLKRLSSLIGVSILWFSCGPHLVHLFITIIGNCILLMITPPSKVKESRLAGKSFVWNFGYLVLFRTVHWIGIPAPSPVTNAAQLFLTLKMIGLAFEIEDCSERHSQKEEKAKDDDDKETLALKMKYCDIDVKPVDVFCYAFCHIGLLTGPYYKYRTYKDWLDLPSNVKLNIKDPLLERARKLPLIAVVFLVFSYFFNIKYVETDEFLERHFLYRLFYMVPMFTIFRTRLYIAWIMSECMSIAAGLGAYPVQSKPRCGSGPTDYKQLDLAIKKEESDPDSASRDFETVHNIDIYGCDLAPRTKQGLRSWNMTVQFWLAQYIHHRVPSFLKAYRVAVTMSVSAFWHGIHPGYYLSFLTVPPILMAEEAMIKAFRNDASPEGQNIFDWVCWFFKMRGFDYNCMGFLLLKFSSTVRYWKSVYFMGHVVTFLFLVIGNVASLVLKPKRKKEKE